MKTFEGYLQADYSPENWVVLLNIKAEGDTNIDDAASIEDVMTALDNAQAAMAAVNTLLDDAKAAAHASLNAAFAVNPQSDYAPDNWAIFSEFKVVGDKAIDSASDLGEVEAAQSTATAEMGGVLTIAQTLAEVKSAAHDTLTAAFEAYNESDYTADAWVELIEFKAAGDAAIEAAADLAVVEMAQSAAAMGMNQVRTIAQALAAAKSAAHDALAAAFGTPQSSEPVDDPAAPQIEGTVDIETNVVEEIAVTAETEVIAETEVVTETEVIAGSDAIAETEVVTETEPNAETEEISEVDQIEDLPEVDLLTISAEAEVAEADTTNDALKEIPLSDNTPIAAEELVEAEPALESAALETTN